MEFITEVNILLLMLRSHGRLDNWINEICFKTIEPFIYTLGSAFKIVRGKKLLFTYVGTVPKRALKCKANLKHQTGCGRETEVGKEGRRDGVEKQREGDKRGLLWGRSPQGVCVCMCVSWEGTVGEFGGMEEGIRALGPAPQGTEKMG